MQKHDEQLLLFIAGKAGLFGRAKTSTAKIAKRFGVSQQTASRKLRALKLAGLITLVATPLGCEIGLSKQGIEVLRQSFLSLQRLFEGSKGEGVLQGTLKSGLGEGRYYISRPFYLQQFRKLLGFKPFLGTLNLVVEPAELHGFLQDLNPIEIPGFRTEERSFGRIKAFRVVVQGKQSAALIFPERTAHQKNEVEVIAAVNLRKKFKLKEGSRVSLQLS